MASVLRQKETDEGLKKAIVITKTVCRELFAIALSVILFYLSFPNDLLQWGLGWLGFVSLLPLLIIINRAPFWRLLIYSPLIGFATYALFNVWLINFHPVAIFVVPTIYMAYYILLIPLLKLPCHALGSYAWIGQLMIWLAYEYLRTIGFLGYPYGIIGYTQYLNIPFVNFASLTGIWGVSALVLMPQFFLAQQLSRRTDSMHLMIMKAPLQSLRSFIIQFKPIILTMFFIYSFALLYGLLSQVDYDDAPRVKMALVQQNVDPSIGGQRAYRKSMEASIRQTKRALEAAPETELIVWSETSFIPAIDFHSRYRTEVERYELVDELLSFIDSIDVPVLLGNGDGQLAIDEEGAPFREDYNAVYLYKQRDENQVYRKLHLVPFTEYFPYKKQLPFLYQILLETDTSFWEHGEEWTVFELTDLKELDTLYFSTPICFEDSFGYLSRGFVRRGADLIINLTNDSWSKSVPAAIQHAAMAVFRSTENRRSVVRSTNGGFTAVIDPNGRILSSNEPFTESFVVVDVPVFTARTGLYTAIGDLFAHIFLVLALITIFISVGLIIHRRRRSTKPKEY